VSRPGSPGPRGSDSGATLVELLVTIAILGITGVAFVGGFFTMTTTSTLHRDTATGDAVLRSYADAVTADTYAECASAYPATSFSAVPGFTAANTVTYWKSDNVFYAYGASGSPCPASADGGLQRVLVSVASTDGRDVETLSVFKRRHVTGETP
jgi:type II secretory pathway pseudopilin PulG